MRKIFSFLLPALLLIACTDSSPVNSVQQVKFEVIHITPATVIEKHLNQSLIIDVREDDEIKSGMIPNAIHIPLSSLQTELPKYLQSLGNQAKDQDIVLYCRSGNRSAVGTNALQKSGYTNVVSMQGGIRVWKAEKHNIVIPN